MLYFSYMGSDLSYKGSRGCAPGMRGRSLKQMLKGVRKRSILMRRIAVAVCALALTVGMAPWTLQDAQAAMVTFS